MVDIQDWKKYHQQIKTISRLVSFPITPVTSKPTTATLKMVNSHENTAL